MVVDDASGVPRLVVSEPARHAGRILPLSRPRTIIGRSERADFRFDDAFVSGQHAVVTVDAIGQVTITDLRSTGGTFVNDERIEEPRVLRPGDLVRFAHLVARFEPGRMPTAPRAGDEVTQVLASPRTDVMPVMTPGKGAAGAETDASDSGGGDAMVADRDGNDDDDARIYTVTGTVRSTAPGVGGLSVRLVDKNVGGDIQLTEGRTDQAGRYLLRAEVSLGALRDRRKAAPDLQVQIMQGKKVMAGSAVSYGAPLSEMLDVALPPGTAGLPSEYEALTESIAALYTGPLTDLKEDGTRQDITYLASKSGWDARAVAMASLAAQFSQNPLAGVGPQPAAGTGKAAKTSSRQAATVTKPVAGRVSRVDPAFYYALFRAGLAANPATLYQTDPATVQQAWTQAISRGVIPQSLADQVPAALRAFQSLSAASMTAMPPPVGPSSLGDLLQLTFHGDAQSQQRMAGLLAQYRDDPTKLWAQAAKTFGPETSARLQLTGQLAYLTVNNAPLITTLLAADGENQITSLADLVSQGYYQAQTWAPLLAAIDAPKEIPGDTPDEQKSNYAELLAAQVRLAYPTAVMAHMVSSGTVPVLGGADVQAQVAEFLAASQDDFDIGAEPIARYLARTGKTGALGTAATAQITRVQRVNQLAPTAQALSGLLRAGVDSAYAVTRYSPSAFATSFAGSVGGEDMALAIYAQARTVYASTLSIALAYLSARRAPAIGSPDRGLVIDPLAGTAPQPAGADGTAAPDGAGGGGVAVVGGSTGGSAAGQAQATLEELFGNLDYCACEDCRSIIGPAAYLVDLLDYIDVKNPSDGFQNPQAVLFGRRPDIGALPLTCENTNVELPYIDLVNETLEYYVSNSLSLGNYAGHSTDGTLSAGELAAAPQFDATAAAAAAFGTLKAAWAPAPLPFHRSLEQLRLLMSTVGLRLDDLMYRLRDSDALERGTPAPGGGTTSYGWRDILAEHLRLSRPEYQLLTDGAAISLGAAYGYAAGTSDATVMSKLPSVREFSRRTGVSYDDLVSILQTAFINPDAALIPLAKALGTSFAAMKELHDGTITAAQFTAQLAAGPDPSRYGGDISAWVNANYDQLMGLIVIDVTGSPCDTTQMKLAYPDPDPAASNLRPVDFLRLNRFIRLWQKLGLSIERTDDLITALCPPPNAAAGAGGPTPQQDLDSRFLTLLPRIGFAYQALDLLGLEPADDLPGLLACWAPIDTTGTDSLYATMFLSPAMLKLDPAFQPVLPDAQPAGGPRLLDHQPALCAAFNLTGAEFSLITADLQYDGTTPLTLPAVSEIYRRGWLARALRLSVRELLLLTSCTRLQPFGGPPDLVAARPAEPPLIVLARLAQAITASGLQPVQVLYLLWNEDLSGVSAPSDAVITGLAGALRQSFAAVDSQFAVKDDPTGALAKSLMTMVTGAPASDYFFGLLTRTVVTSTDYSAPGLPQAVLDAGDGRLGYDDFAKKLTFAGLLDTKYQNALTAAAAGNGNLLAALTNLAAANAKSTGSFFAAYQPLGLKALCEAFEDSADPLPARYNTLLAGLAGSLATRRKEQQALAAIVAAAGCDASFGPALLDDTTVMHSTDGSSAAVTDLTAIAAPGLDVQYSGNDPGTAVPAYHGLSYGDSAPLPPPAPPGTTIQATWTGYVCAQEDGDYDITITADHGAAVTLSLAGNTITLAKTSAQPADTWANTQAISLTAGQLTPVTLQATGLSAIFSASWATTGTGWQPIPATALYPGTLVSNLRGTYVRFLKITALAAGLSLTAPEIAYLATQAQLTAGGRQWADALTVDGQPGQATSADLGTVLDAVLAYSRLKAKYDGRPQRSPDAARLPGVLRQMTTNNPDPAPALLALTGWDPVSLTALLRRVYGAASPGGITQAGAPVPPLTTMRRLDDAFTVVSRSGLTADKLIPAATNDPDAAGATTAEDFQAAVRSRYAEPDWLTVIKPVSDTIRELERDALVAYILVQARDIIFTALGVQDTTRACTTEDLFSYFLFDVEMQPCMPTSRIRHALSSVQLFIERALRNLEPLVSPGDVDVTQWTWRKRFRVWQANREVFLWPENWMDEALRDDQSPFFATTVKQLLQSDVTDDSAAAAYLDYLTSLEQVALLEPCGICYIAAADGSGNDTAHVVARTSGANRKHYYRRLEDGAWTPWEEIKLHIEGNPVTPYVWNGRLLLFWLQIHHSPTVTSGNLTGALPSRGAGGTTLGAAAQEVGAAAVSQTQSKIGAVLCFSEYSNGKWQPPKTSDPATPLDLLATDYSQFDRSTLALRPWTAADPKDGSLYLQVTTADNEPRTENWVFAQAKIWYGGRRPDERAYTTEGDIYGPLKMSTGFVLHNTHSAPLRWTDVPAVPLMAPTRVRALTDSAATLSAAYGFTTSPGSYDQFSGLDSPIQILTGKLGLPQAVTEAQPDVADQWNLPFFFADARNAFYVTTTESTVLFSRFSGLIRGGSALSPGALNAGRFAGLVTPQPPAPPGDPATTSDFANPAAAKRALALTPGIRFALGTPDTIDFNGTQIGFTGGIAAPPAAGDGTEVR